MRSAASSKLAVRPQPSTCLAAKYYEADETASAVSATLFAAEELGKYYIPRELSDAVRSGTKISTKQICDAIKNHEEKPSRALSESTTRGIAADTKIGFLLNQLGTTTKTAPRKMRERIGQKLSEALARTREQALYVDIDPGAKSWHRPSVSFKK
jgi:AbiV family abortive infection protein